MKIVIEGMDGAGKSTIAQIVSEKLNIKYVDGSLKRFLFDKGVSENDMNIFFKIRDLYSDFENSVLRTWSYGFANLFNLLHYDGDLIIDRHCLTTYYYNGDEKSKFLYKIMQEIAGKPDLVIILRASISIRVSRIRNRNKLDPDLLKKEKMVYGYDIMENAAKFLNLNYKIIDTDDKNIEQTVNAVVEIIEGEIDGTLLVDNREM